jgi:anaphase-promoting complex subunit 3
MFPETLNALMQVGKMYFELVDYLEAERVFNRARQITPYSLDGMDIYSTVLYVSQCVFYL